MTRLVVVTGTDTGVGKTVATAALAARAARPSRFIWVCSSRERTSSTQGLSAPGRKVPYCDTSSFSSS